MNKGIFQTKLRTGDEVIVISGKDLGKKGTLREILKSKNLHENLGKINGEHKGNELIKEVIAFIEKDKKRPICTPKS